MSRKLQTATNIFLINLSISQTAMCLIWIFVSATYLNLMKWLRSDATCQVLHALSVIATYCMSLTITVVPLNRYLLITKTKETYSRVFSRRNVVCILVFSWLSPTVTVVIPQVSGPDDLVKYDMSAQRCVNTSDHPKGKALALFGVICSTIAFLVTLCSYCKIFRHVRQSTRSLESSSNTSQAHRQRNMELKVTKTLLCLICFYFILCIGPSIAPSLAFVVHRGNKKEPGYALAMLIVLYICGELVVLNTCVNPA
ncbi:melanopsin-like [Diadema setosum]|uniref:melanopsin-like n=1 Tax=Diadema setosum TaxID=31175 RepID=UPI003B3A0CF9